MKKDTGIRIGILLIVLVLCSIGVKSQSVSEWSEPYRNWHYYPSFVVPPNPDIAGFKEVKMTDVPTVFQIPGDDKWYMTFIGFDGQGYQSFIAESEDLINWGNYRLAMGYGPEGEFDYGGVVLGAYLYEDYNINAPRVLKKKNGRFYSLYGAYPRQGGYELRPGYEGIAWSDDGISWERAKDEPILSVHQEDCKEWEQSCIYQPWLVEHDGQYYNFYNAANGSIEQLGLAESKNLFDWKRYANNPVIQHGFPGSYNEKFSSDIKVFWDKDHWVGFFFGVGQDGAHIMAAYSKDLYDWTVDPEPLYKAGGNPSGIDGRYAHKISLVWNPESESYYMFYCAVDTDGNRGIGLISSKPFDQKDEEKVLPVPGEVFEVDGRPAFLIVPENYDTNKPLAWVWYAPTLPKLPAIEEKWMFERFLEAGIAVGGIDVGESYGNPEGRAYYTEFYNEMVNKRGLAKKACLLARSRGGLMLYNWAVENPESVACIAGIYPVGNLSSWPGLDHACASYKMTSDQLASELSKHNPIDRLEPLAEANVPIFHIHGDEDDVVPLDANSALIKERYEKLGGQMTLEIVKGQGHNMWPGWFHSQNLVDFIIDNSRKNINHATGVYVTDLKCEYQVNPLGIDVLKPRLSWMIKSQRKGEKQTAYRILVASTRKNLNMGLGDLWDTGQTFSDQSIHNVYQGKSLRSDDHCYWKVMIWDKNGKASSWSKPAKWSMGLLNPDDWKAKWIGSGKEDTSPWYRHQFNLDENPDQAIVYLASLGYYELYINGHKIGNEVLGPAVSNFSKRSYYQTFDISPYLIKGDNCVAVWMGQGWYSPGLPGVKHHSPVVRAQINLRRNGTETNVISDTSWLCHSSSRSLLGNWRWGKFGGELIDARQDKSDWNLVNTSTEGWEKTVEVEVADVPCTAQDCSGNVTQNPIIPVSVESLDSNKILVDFGTNLTGLMQIRFHNLKEGAKITMHYADMDARDSDFIGHGDLMKDGFSVLGQYDEFISAGAPEELFSNVFNYHAFRYALIEGLSYIPKKEDIAAIPVSGKLDVVGSFTCSNELYNRINDMVVWTYSCLNLGGQTVDCPHRERLGYGDGQTIMDLGCFNFYAPDMYSKWSQNWWDEQTEDGFVPFTAPSPHGTGGGPAWGAMCIMVPWKTYLFYDDQRLLEEGYPYMKKYMDYLSTHCEDGILKDIFPGERWPNLGDWVPPRRGMDKADWVDDHSRRFFNNCYRVHLLQIMQKVAQLLGENEDVAAFDRDISLSQKKIHEAWFNPNENTYANGEQPYLIFPLMTGVTPEHLRDALLEKYTETLLKTDKGHLNTGMIGTQIMTDYLLEINRNDLVDNYVNKKTYPGWGYMVESGATTCGEQWNMNYSQIHSCFPYIGGWFYKGLAGISWDPEAPGFKNVVLRPGIVTSVDWVKCSYESPYGKIVSNWKTERDLFEWQITIPPNSTAKVFIPGTDIKVDGIEAGQSESITFLANDGNYSVFKVESGVYFFNSQTSIINQTIQ